MNVSALTTNFSSSIHGNVAMRPEMVYKAAEQTHTVKPFTASIAFNQPAAYQATQAVGSKLNVVA